MDNEGYLSLCEAIWAKALQDDIKHIKVRILVDTTENVFPKLSKYPRDNRTHIVKIKRYIKEQYGESGLNSLEQLQTRIDENMGMLITAVKEKLRREVERWPDNPRTQDKQFEGTYRKIMDEILKQYAEAIA